jgi:hypothetical protein
MIKYTQYILIYILLIILNMVVKKYYIHCSLFITISFTKQTKQIKETVNILSILIIRYFIRDTYI